MHSDSMMTGRTQRFVSVRSRWMCLVGVLGVAALSCRPAEPAPASTPPVAEAPPAEPATSEADAVLCEPLALGDDLPSKRVAAVVELLNAPTREAIEAFGQDQATAEMTLRWPIEEQEPILQGWRRGAGAATICRIVERSEDRVVGLLGSKGPEGDLQYRWLEVELDRRQQSRVIQFQAVGTSADALTAERPYGLALSTRSVGGEPLAADPEARRAMVEANLTRSIRVGGRNPQTVQQRMAELKVPGLSVAVIHEGKVEWARGYGVLRTGEKTQVDTHTMFQAASMSKPVTVLAALRLVEAGELDLDTDVGEYLSRWSVPPSEHTKDAPVTIRHLASHCAGLTVHGFRGYAEGEAVPTVPQILDGASPANNDPIVVDKPPGQGFRYSGGGTTILQQLLSDVTGKPFPKLLARSVLKEVGMRRSTFEQPLPKRFHPNAAVGHRNDGTVVPGRWHTYPEMGAAGLWTRPIDLAELLIEVHRAYAGDDDTLVGMETARAALTRQCPGMVPQPGSGAGYVGLGFMVAPRSGDLRYGHGGANEGYRSQMLMDVQRGSGVVVMTNSDNGGQLADEVVNAVAHVYGWPAHEHSDLELAPLDTETFDRVAGNYEFPPGTPVPVTGARFIREGQTVRMTFSDGFTTELYPTGKQRFLALEPLFLSVEFGHTGDEDWVQFDGPRGPKAIKADGKSGS